MNSPTLSLAEAARTTGVSVSTLRRRLTAGQIDGAQRAPDGSWSIPIAGLIAAGLAPRTTPADTPTSTSSTPDTTAEVERLRSGLEASHRREIENLTAEVERLRGDNGRLLELLERLTRALPPASEHTTSSTLEAEVPASVSRAPRRRWQRFTKHRT